MSKEEVHLFLYKTMKKDISLNEFEPWLYEHDELESIVGSDHYYELISTNFKDKYAFETIEKLIKEIISIAEFEEKRIRKLLSEITTSKDSISKSAEEIYDEYCNGYSFLRFIALTYISTAGYDEVSVFPNESSIKPYRNKIRTEATRLLKFLESGEITIICEYIYIDSRNFEDKIEEHSLEKMYDS